MNNNLSSFTLHTLHLHDATIDEEDSYNFLHHFLNTKKYNYYYRYPDLPLETLQFLSSQFCLFYAKIQSSKTKDLFQTNFPIRIFRYIMLDDGSWSNYYTTKRKNGYVVEGMHWSNGLVYQVRQDAQSNFEIYEATLSIDSITKTMYNFPDIEK